MRHTSKKRAARAQSDLPAETIGQIIQLSANCASATPAGECCCGDVIRTRLLHFFGDALTGGDAKSAILASRTFARPRHDQIAPASCRSPTQYLAGSYRHSGSCLPRARKQPLGSEVFAGAVRRLAVATGLPDIAVFKLFQVMRPFKPSAPSAPLAGAFELRFEQGVATHFARDGAAAWDGFVTGYGPTKALAPSIDDSRRSELKQALNCLL